MIPERVSIWSRPLGATNRTRYAHLEGDTAVAPKRVDNNVAVALAAERKSKLLVGEKIQSLSSKRMSVAVRHMHEQVKIKSITLDNGIENRDHRSWGVATFFTDPQSPQQKPLIEQSIGLLRRWFFPKGTDWSMVGESEIADAISYLNGKYRKSLGYASALEVASAHDIIKSEVALGARI